VKTARRHYVVALTFVAAFVAYTDRVNISVAAVAMKEDLGWSQTEKGYVLSAFFVGYMLFLAATGWLAQKYGGKIVLGAAVVAWSAFTLVTPPAATHGLATLIAARIAMGIGEAAMFPAVVELYTRWVPASERARAMARVLSGIPLGTVVGLLVTGWIVGRFRWPMAFYAFGALGVVWAALWLPVKNDPKDDPRVGPEERALLTPPPAEKEEKISIWSVLRHKSVLAMMGAHFASNWTLYVLLAWLPSYFRDVQHISITSAGEMSAAPWLGMFLGTNVAAPISDRMIARGASVTRTRKLMQAVGLLGSAAFLVAMRDVGTPLTAVALLCGATFTLGFAWSGFAPNSLDLSPRHAAVIFGVSNTFATIPGIVGVAVTGWLVDATGTYASAFVLTAAVSGVCMLAYAVAFDAKPITE